jgi:hypothetical protein
MAKSQAPLKIVGGRNPSLNYAPPARINHAVPGAEWPFAETRKAAGDVVISGIAVTETRRAKTEHTGFVRSMMARLSSKGTF